MRRFLLTLMLAAAAPALPPAITPAWSQAPSLEPGAPPLAEQRYQIGRELYAKNDIAGAAREFKTALALYPTSAKLAYNLARCEERLGEVEPAIEHYQLYLTLAPEAEDGPAVNALIGALEVQRVPDPEPEVPPTPKLEPITEPIEEPKPQLAPEPVAEPVPPLDEPRVPHWGIMLGGSNDGTFRTDLPLPEGTLEYEESIQQAAQVVAMWDTPLWRGLRVGAEIGFATVEVQARQADQDGAAISVGHVSARVRYLFEFGDFRVFPAVSLGPTFLTLQEDGLDGEGFGVHIAGRLGIGYSLGAVELFLVVSGEIDNLATFDLTAEDVGRLRAGVSATVEAEETELRRGALSLGVWF